MARPWTRHNGAVRPRLPFVRPVSGSTDPIDPYAGADPAVVAGHALRDASDVAGTHLQPHPLGQPPRRHVVEADVELAVAGVIDPQHFGVHPTTIRFTR